MNLAIKEEVESLVKKCKYTVREAPERFDLHAEASERSSERKMSTSGPVLEKSV